MVNHQISRDEWVGQFRVCPQTLQRIAHRREIHHARHARKILHERPRRTKLNFLRRRFRIPLGHILNIAGLYRAVILEAQQIFEQHPD